MKIKDFVKESRTYEQELRTFVPEGWEDEDPFGEISQDERDDLDPFGEMDSEPEQPEMNLSSNADAKMINAVRKVCDQYKGQGHAQVELLPFLTKVMEFVKKPVNLADLIAINKKSPEIQALVDTIDEKKVKFKNMSVKNEDPGKERAQAQAKRASTVSSMASRAVGK